MSTLTIEVPDWLKTAIKELAANKA